MARYSERLGIIPKKTWHHPKKTWHCSKTLGIAQHASRLFYLMELQRLIAEAGISAATFCDKKHVTSFRGKASPANFSCNLTVSYLNFSVYSERSARWQKTRQ
jgi:hypothetical protein